MKLKYFIPSLVAIIAALFTGCSEDNDPTYFSDLQVSQSYVALNTSGGSTSIDVVANGSWTVTGAPDWLTVSPTSGTGNGTITFSADAAEGRTAEVLLTCDGKTQHINIIQGIATVSTATCAEVLAGPDSKTYRVSGTVTNIVNTTYGNWYLNDGTGEVYIYGTLDSKGGTKNFLSWGLEVGDQITVEGPKTTYNGTVELVDVTVVKIVKSLIKCDSLTIAGVVASELPVEGGEITANLTCKGSGVAIEVPESAQSWLGVVSSTVGANPTVTLRATENTGADREATVVFKTTDSGKEYTAQAVVKQKGVAKGSGTDTDPYNVAAAIGYTKSLGADVVSEKDVYVKGIISSVKYTYSADYGTATYNISDDGTESGVFTVYSSYYFDGQPWVEGNDQIKVGDEVVVVGKVIYYKGSTPEFSSKQNWLFSLNGKTSSVTATVAEFLAAAEDDTRYSLTGVITSLYDSDKKGMSYYIKDYSGETLVYRTDGFLDSGIKVGDVVTVVGKRSSYKDNPQMVNGSTTLLHAVTPVTIAEFLTKPDDKGVYYMVTGKISSLLGSNGKENDYGNLYITDGTTELYVYGTYSGWGATGEARKYFIADNGLKVGDEITIIGYKDTYKELVELCQGVCFSFKKAE